MDGSVRPLLVVCLGLGCLAAAALNAQEAEPLVTDRPDFTESALTVPAGRFQLEGGYTYEDAGEEQTDSLGELLLRVGVGQRLELRLAVNPWVSVRTPGEGDDPSGLEDPAIGLKLVLREDRDDRRSTPQAALLLAAALPLGSSEHREPHVQPGGLLALAWDLDERWSLGSNLGLALGSSDGEQFAEAWASLALGRALSERTGAYVELFGFAREAEVGADTAFFDARLTRLLSDDLQLDLRAGFGLQSAAPDYFIGAGFGWRH